MNNNIERAEKQLITNKQLTFSIFFCDAFISWANDYIYSTNLGKGSNEILRKYNRRWCNQFNKLMTQPKRNLGITSTDHSRFLVLLLTPLCDRLALKVLIEFGLHNWSCTLSYGLLCITLLVLLLHLIHNTGPLSTRDNPVKSQLYIFIKRKLKM
jgi:hypothetical protein